MARWSRPTFEDRLLDRRAAALWSLLHFALVLMVPGALLSLATASAPVLAVIIHGVLISTLVGALALLRARRVKLASATFVGVVTVLLAVLQALLGGNGHAHSAGFLLVVLLARSLLGGRAMLLAGAVSLAVIIASGVAEQVGLALPRIGTTTLDESIAAMMFLLFAGMLAHGIVGSLEVALAEEHRLGEAQRRLADRATAIAQLARRGLSAPNQEAFAADAARVLVEVFAAESAWLLQVASGRVSVLAASGRAPTLEAVGVLTRLHAALEVTPRALGDGERLAGAGATQLGAAISQGCLLIVGFAEARALEVATPSVSTIASLLGAAHERERQRDELVQLHKYDAAGRLAGNVGHEFNNLLTAILGEARSIEEESAGATRDGARAIRSAAERGALLTRRLLSVARRNVVQPERLDLARALRHFGASFGRWTTDGVALEIVRGDERLFSVLDPDELEQVLHALCTNAVQAMPGGGLLRIALLRDEAERGSFARLEISDTGHGMTEPTRRRLFEPFFSTRPDGAGLGLATCRAILERVGGSVELAPGPAGGTRATVRLPLAGVEARGADPSLSSIRVVQPLAVVADEKLRLLVVDDEPMVRKVTARALRRAGYDVEEATDGEDALQQLEQKPGIVLVVTDAIMPKLGGVELARRVRAERGLPVILISGYTDALPEGEHEVPFLAKPYDPRELAELVRATLAGRPLPPARDGVERAG